MKKMRQFKPVFLLAACIPGLVAAQALQHRPASSYETMTARSPAPTLAPVALSFEKATAVKELMSAIGASKLAEAIAKNSQEQAQRLVPIGLSQALDARKDLTDKQKQDAVPELTKKLPALAANAGAIFGSSQFRNDALTAQRNAYAKYYTTGELKELTRFYRSETGRKFIQVQDQVGRDVLSSLMQKYVPQVDQEIQRQTEAAVAAIKP